MCACQSENAHRAGACDATHPLLVPFDLSGRHGLEWTGTRVFIILPRMFPRAFHNLSLATLLASGAAGCTPLIRFGEIEPPEGARTLVDSEVQPQRKQDVAPNELAAAVSDATVGVLVTTPMPAVPSSEARDEMASSVQGSSVPADDALVDEAQLATDARRLESIYMARGYFRAKNLGHTVVVRGKDRAAVEFEVLEGSETKVTEILFRGACEINEDPDPEKLKRLHELCSEAPALIPMLVGDTWSEDAYANGLDVLARAFRAAGFLHARVSGDNWVSRDRYEAAVWYDIDSGPLVRVMGDVIVDGNVHVGEHRIRRRIDIHEGDVIDDELLRTTERNVQELGPFFSVQAAVVREATVEPTPNTPLIQVVPPQMPGPVVLAPGAPPGDAPKSTLPKVGGPTAPTSPAPEPIEKVAPEAPVPETDPAADPKADPKAPKQKGDAPDDPVAPEVAPVDTLEGDPPKMSPTDAVPPSVERPDRMRVKVQIAEAPRWEFTVGPSVVTDFLRLDLALPMAFTHRNLFSEVVAVTASARPALVMPNCFSGKACFDKPEFGLEAKAGIQVPSFFEEYLRLAIDATYKRDPTQDAKSQEIGGSIGLSRRLFPGLTARIGYNISFFNYFGTFALSGLSSAERAEQQDYLIKTAALRFEKQDFLAWIDVALVLDLRDSPLDARNGFFTSLSLNASGTYSGSDVPYTRLLGDMRGYWTPRFLKWLTLAARLKVGMNFFEADKGTPQPARFKSGGATSMRGFATDRIGDYVCAEPDGGGSYLNNPKCQDLPTERTYIGGNYVIESNFELRFHLRGGIGLVWFADVGRVWSVGGFDLADLYVATGPGFRYDLPVGPIRFDLGFLLGENRATQLHFSLGQAF